MQLTDFDVLTFDCYGTLIDWETGIFQALQPLLAGAGLELARDAVLETFARFESTQQAATPDMLYSELLARVHAQLSTHWNFSAADDMHARFGAAVPDWPAFTDSVAALAYLKQHYKLVILSNVDRTGFAASNRRLQVEFDAIYTAQDVGSYKPDPRNFDYLIEHLKDDLGLAKSQILHTAQSLFHDHVPAKRIGLACAWIDRRKGQEGWGATAPPEKIPEVEFHFASMAEIADAHRVALADQA